MTIKREDVADLQPGDVVEYHNWDWPNGVTIRGALYTKPPGGLWIGDQHLRMEDGDVRSGDYWKGTLTVVSRAPRPLYVNHPRTEPVPGDVVSRGDNDGATWSWGPLRTGACRWRNTANDEWYAAEDFLDFGNGLRLLVDGETGMPVTEGQAEAWDQGFEAAAEWAANNPGPGGVPHDPPSNPYETGQVVP